MSVFEPSDPKEASQTICTVPFVSIVVPLFNHLAETQAMLASLQASLADRDDWELTLIDDGSTDGTREWLDSLHLPNVRVMKNACNQGFARTNNIAVAQCRGDVLVLANNDLVFGPGWLQPMLDVLFDPGRQAGLVGNVQTRVVDGAIDHTGVDLNFRGQLDHVRVAPAQEGVAGAVQRFAVTAACIAIRRPLFVELGGFDEAYVNGCEDMDLCFKVAQSGRRNWVALDSVVQHHVSLSRGGASERHERNSELLYRRWGDALRARLAQKWTDWLQQGQAAEPSDGRDELLLPQEGRHYGPIDGTHIADCVLQRNALYQAEMLNRPVPALDYSSVACKGDVVLSALAGYVFPGAAFVVDLPPGVGQKGLFLLGQVVGLPTDSAPWRVTLEFNGLQRWTYSLDGLDFNVGSPRPLVWADKPSQVKVVFEPPPDISATATRVYLSRMVLDGDVPVYFGPMVQRLVDAPSIESGADAAAATAQSPSPDTTARLTTSQWAALSPELFVQHAYWALLGRAADPGGFEGYVNALSSGLSRERLWEELASSDEAKRRHGGF